MDVVKMEELIQAVSTYGLPIVLSGLVLFLAFRFGLLLLKHYEEKLGSKKHDELALLRNQVSSTVDALLDRTVLKTKASRVYVFEFHNGVTPLGGLPFLKMTNTYEALGNGAVSEIHRREGIAMQLFPSFVKAIYEKDCIVLDTENKTEDYSSLVWATLEEQRVGVTVRAKITDLKGMVIGYLGIDYCTGSDYDRDTVYEATQIIQDAAGDVGTLLCVNQKK